MNYSQTLEYLYHALPMFSRTGPKGFKPNLDKTRALCDSLGNPERHFTSIHIAGTNGKGSVSNMLAAIFQEHGYKTGLYTSPHLRDFRERIRINGKMIPRRLVVEFVKNNLGVSERVQPSFFELTFAMAMKYFADEGVDIAIIETGLGGRLDSTNIVQPVLSIITNIGMDHMDVLGDTPQKIAFEKAGIIKNETPVIIGEATAETTPVFVAKAKSVDAPLFFAEDAFDIIAAKGGKYYVVRDKGASHSRRYVLDLKGGYQLKNLRTVLLAIDLLKKKFSLDTTVVRRALTHVARSTGLEGRWQIIHRKPLIVLDVAHNIDGVREVMKQVVQTPHEKLRIVIGMVKDKDISAVLGVLPKTATYYFTNAPIARALPATDLQEKASSFGLRGKKIGSVNDAIIAALQDAFAADMILVCGSVFVIGEVDKKLIRQAITGMS